MWRKLLTVCLSGIIAYAAPRFLIALGVPLGAYISKAAQSMSALLDWVTPDVALWGVTVVIALSLFGVKSEFHPAAMLWKLIFQRKHAIQPHQNKAPGHWVPMTTEENNNLRTKLAQLSPKKGRILFKPNYSCEDIADSLRGCFRSIKWDVDSDDTLYWTPDEGICITAHRELGLFICEAIERSLGNKSGIKVNIKSSDQNVDFSIIIGKRPT